MSALLVAVHRLPRPNVRAVVAKHQRVLLVDELELAGHVTRRQRVVARDHCEVVRGVEDLFDDGLGVGLEGTGDDEEAGELQLALDAGATQVAELLVGEDAELLVAECEDARALAGIVKVDVVEIRWQVFDLSGCLHLRKLEHFLGCC